MNIKNLVDRLTDLAHRQYGPLFDQLNTVPPEIEAALRGATDPVDPVTAGDLIRRGLLAIADRLMGIFKDWTRCHQAAESLSEPFRTAWLLREYLGVDTAEAARLMDITSHDLDAAVLDAKRHVLGVLDARKTPGQAGFDEAALDRELWRIHKEVTSPKMGVIRKETISYVRGRVQKAVFGDETPGAQSLRAFYLAFGKLYRRLRLRNCEEVGAPYPRSQKLKREADNERAWLVSSWNAREALRESDQFADECFALMEDACLDLPTVAELMGKPVRHIQETVLRYHRAIDQWIEDQEEDPG